MPSIFEDQKAFMTACGQTTSFVNQEQAKLYAKLVNEEYTEFLYAETLVERVDGAIDLIYVLCGWMHSMGLSPQEFWDEVQRSNMVKVDPATGLVYRRSDGKIMKPDGWKPPELELLIQRQLEGNG